MVKRTAWMGTALVAAAGFAVGPAVADTLTGFVGFADATYTHSTFSGSSSLDGNKAAFGVGFALPVADIPNLNWQLDASYAHVWSQEYTHFSPNFCSPPASTGTPCARDYSDSAALWNFGFSPFLAYGGSRWGANFNYQTLTHFGHITNGGLFMEWYLTDQITLASKGGYISSGGSPFGGHGQYLAGAGTFYAMPDLAVTAAVDWTDIVTNGLRAGCLGCQLNVGGLTWSLEGEWLPMQQWGFSVFGGFAYNQRDEYKVSFNESIWKIGLRWYTGEGSLAEHHRNGTLRNWLRGT